MKDPTYQIPQHHLTTAIEGLQELSQRLELEAVTLAGVNLGEAAADRLERVETIRGTVDFFLHL